MIAFWTAIAAAQVSPPALPLVYHDGGSCDAELPEDYCVEALHLAFAAWEGTAPCANTSAVYAGFRDGTSLPSDGSIHVIFGDPDDTLESTIISTVAEAIEGSGTKVLLNDDVDWVTHEAALAGADGIDLRAFLTREVGRRYGLDDACGLPSSCDDPNAQAALMNPNGDAHQIEPQTWDIEAMTALHVPRVEVACSEPIDAPAAVPRTTRCVVVPEPHLSVASARWDFGDGATAEGLAVEHTWNGPGVHTLEATASVTGEACFDDLFEGDVHTATATGEIVVCPEPQPVFAVEHVAGLTYQVRNETPVDLDGCHTDIVWDVYRGEARVWSGRGWEPRFTVPAAGVYTVWVHLGGVGATGAASLSFATARGCRVAPLPHAGGLALAALLLLRRRR